MKKIFTSVAIFAVLASVIFVGDWVLKSMLSMQVEVYERIIFGGFYLFALLNVAGLCIVFLLYFLGFLSWEGGRKR